MNYLTYDKFPQYQLYVDGSVFNTKTKKPANAAKENTFTFVDGKQHQKVKLSRIFYELHYGIIPSNNDKINFVDDTLVNKYTKENLVLVPTKYKKCDEYIMNSEYNFHTFDAFPTYSFYENGEIGNINQNNKKVMDKGDGFISLHKNGDGPTRYELIKIYYELYNNVELAKDDKIIFIDHTIPNKYHKDNLLLINNKTGNVVKLNNDSIFFDKYKLFIFYDNGNIFSIRSKKLLHVDENNRVKLNKTMMELGILYYSIYNNFKLDDTNHVTIVDNTLNSKYVKDNLMLSTGFYVYKYNDELNCPYMKKINGYKFYETGEIYDTLNKVLKGDGENTIVLRIGKKKKQYKFATLFYQVYHNEIISEKEEVTFQDDTLVNKYKQNNLAKIRKRPVNYNKNECILDPEKEWRNIPEYPDYKINICGDIYSSYSNIILMAQKNIYGYTTISLKKDGKYITNQVHVLIYETFVGPVSAGNIVDHIDRNKDHNHLSNLREVTPVVSAANRTYAKVVENKIYQYDTDGTLIKEWKSVPELTENGYNKDLILRCCKGKQQYAYGCIWKHERILENLDLYEFVPVVTGDDCIYSHYVINKEGEIVNTNNNFLLRDYKNGYPEVTLMSDSFIPKKYRVHRLVALTFVPNDNNLPQVNHIDEDKSNKEVSNLEWTDGEGNIAHTLGKPVHKIDKNTGEILATYKSIAEAQRAMNKKGSSAIHSACKGKSKTAYGFIWKLVE